MRMKNEKKTSKHVATPMYANKWSSQTTGLTSELLTCEGYLYKPSSSTPYLIIKNVLGMLLWEKNEQSYVTQGWL